MSRASGGGGTDRPSARCCEGDDRPYPAGALALAALRVGLEDCHAALKGRQKAVSPPSGRAEVVRVFVENRVVVPVPFERARDAFQAALADGGLAIASRRAAEQAMSAVLTPAGYHHVMQAIGNQVRVNVDVNQRFIHDVVAELRWSPAGMARQFFPELDADLALSPRSRDDSGMSIVACYRRPSGFGPHFARVLAFQVAQATADAFLGDLRNRLIAANIAHAALRSIYPLSYSNQGRVLPETMT